MTNLAGVGCGEVPAAVGGTASIPHRSRYVLRRRQGQAGCIPGSVSERPLVAQHHWRSCQQASAHAGSAHSASGGPAWGAPWEGGPSEHQQDCRVGIPFRMGAQGKLPWHLLISQTLLGRLLPASAGLPEPAGEAVRAPAGLAALAASGLKHP